MEPADEVDGGGERGPTMVVEIEEGGLASMYGEMEIENRHAEPPAS
jgi:hypothetical protein